MGRVLFVRPENRRGQEYLCDVCWRSQVLCLVEGEENDA